MLNRSLNFLIPQSSCKKHFLDFTHSCCYNLIGLKLWQCDPGFIDFFYRQVKSREQNKTAVGTGQGTKMKVWLLVKLEELFSRYNTVLQCKCNCVVPELLHTPPNRNWKYCGWGAGVGVLHHFHVANKNKACCWNVIQNGQRP